MAIKILLVDDEVDIADGMKKLLEYRGFEVLCAYDGLDAFKKAKEMKPDIVLLDLFMPIVHGYDVCRKMKKSDDLKNTPVLLLSAGQSSANEAKNVGAEDFIRKPFEIDELVDKIKFYTKKKGLGAAS